MIGKWTVFAALSAAFFLLNLGTFATLGVVLFSMVGELHWSMTEAGFSFSLLGIACGLSSPLPNFVMRRFGGRATICLGALMLVGGALLASVSQTIEAFYLAMILLGSGFSMAGNVPGIAMIAAWFPQNTARYIGIYLMLGALGGAFGPPIVDAVVRGEGWRFHWQALAAASILVALLCLLCLRDKATPDAAPDTGSVWTQPAAIRTPQFLLVALAMTMTMASVTTNSSVAVAHLVKLGASPTAAAYVLSLIAVSATFVKGAAGRVCESVPPTFVLAAGLVLQGLGSLVLAVADGAIRRYAAGLMLGSGWGVAYVAATVLLLDYFGPTVGSRILGVVWLLTTVAAAGPVAAGMIADATGSFAPIFLTYAGLLAVLAIPISVMRSPTMLSERRPA